MGRPRVLRPQLRRDSLGSAGMQRSRLTTPLRILVWLPTLSLFGMRPPLYSQVVRWHDATGRQFERQCEPTRWPKNLPPLDAVLDTTILAQISDSQSISGSTTMLLGVLYQQGGAPTVTLLAADSLSSKVSEAFALVLTRGLRPLSPPERLGAVRLRISIGVHSTATVERSLYCPPEVAPGAAAGSRIVEVPVLPGDPIPPRRMVAELSIDETGQVVDVRLHARSGISDLDDSFVQNQWQRRFLPALVDGLAIPSWVRTTGQRMQL